MHYAAKPRSKGFDRIFLYIVFLPIEQKTSNNFQILFIIFTRGLLFNLSE